MLKVGLKVEKKDQFVKMRVDKIRLYCLKALKISAEHQKRHTAKKLIKFLSKYKIKVIFILPFLFPRTSHESHDLGLALRSP